MKYYTILVLCAACLTTNCYGQVKESNVADSVEFEIAFNEFNISMMRLIANPEKYNGKWVQLHGFFNYSFEGTALYYHKEDFDHHLTVNAVQINFSKNNLQKDLTKYNGRYVILAGMFEISKGGIFAGVIKDVMRLD